MHPLLVVREVLLLVHLIGFAFLLGGWASQAFTRRYQVTALTRSGLGVMIGSGLILAIPFPAGTHLDYVKLGVKLVIAVAIGAVFGVIITRARTRRPSTALFWSVGALAVINAGIALVWT
jgi:hypothetical protein